MSRRGATKATYIIAAIGGALYFAARTTGAGWLLVILCGLAGVLLVGWIWPRIGLQRVRIEASGPTDATADEAFAVTLRVWHAGLGVRISPVSPIGVQTAAVGDATTTIEVLPERRGLIRSLDLDVASAAPFGLVWWRRRITVPLDRTVEVAPRTGPATLTLPPAGALGDDSVTYAGTSGDQVRGVRDYVSGDPMRHVHWAATARRGSVVVKDFEQPERPRLELVVDLRGSDDAAEATAEEAMGIVRDALTRGITVTVSTAEATGPRRATVTSTLDAGRRLARAVAGPLPTATPGDASVTLSAGTRR